MDFSSSTNPRVSRVMTPFSSCENPFGEARRSSGDARSRGFRPSCSRGRCEGAQGDRAFSDLTKEYEAEVRFGAVSTTYDAAGVLTETIVLPGWEPPTIEALKNTIEDRFLGRIRQVPPGVQRRSYRRRARTGKRCREGSEYPSAGCVRAGVHHTFVSFPGSRSPDHLWLRHLHPVLAHDLGQVLRFGAYLSGLQRTKVGEWSAEHARAPENVLWTNVIPLKEALSSFPRIDLTSEEFEALRHGRDLEKAVKPTTFGWHEDLPVVMLEMKNGKGHARKVL